MDTKPLIKGHSTLSFQVITGFFKFLFLRLVKRLDISGGFNISKEGEITFSRNVWTGEAHHTV